MNIDTKTLKINLFFFIIYCIPSYGQVGINTNTPVSTLDILGNPSSSTVVDGLLAPRISLTALIAKDNLYTTNLAGTIVYVNDISNSVSTKTTNITSEGYYIFDGDKWYPFIQQSKTNVINVSGLNSNLSSPNIFSGATFNPNTPTDTDAVFINNADGSTWIYNGSQYKICKTPSNSNWFLAQTLTDASGNKNNSIYRMPKLGINNSNPSEQLDVNGNIRFSSALMPNGDAGQIGYFLISNGTNPPLFKSPQQQYPTASIDLNFLYGYYEKSDTSPLVLPEITNVNYAGKIIYVRNISGAAINISTIGNFYPPLSNISSSFSLPNLKTIQLISYYKSNVDKGWVTIAYRP